MRIPALDSRRVSLELVWNEAEERFALSLGCIMPTGESTYAILQPQQVSDMYEYLGKWLDITEEGRP